MDAPLRLVIFDVDGTLVDSQGHILASMRWAFGEAGLTAPPRETILSIVGLSLPEAMRVLVPGADEDLVARLVALYKEGYTVARAAEAETVFYPGALEALRRIEASGILISAATGKSRRGLDRILDQSGLRAMFMATQTADDAPSKPHPQMVLNCLAGTGVDARQAVMVGDTSFDIEMARAAGCHAIGVAWGYHETTALEAAGAHQIIHRFDDLALALDRAWEAA